MPSKKLVQTVLNIVVTDLEVCGETLCWNKTDALSANVTNGCGNFEGSMAFQTFVHKCKEWLIHEQHQSVWSGNGWEKLEGYECTIASFYGGDSHTFKASNEADAIFQACEEFLK